MFNWIARTVPNHILVIILNTRNLYFRTTSHSSVQLMHVCCFQFGVVRMMWSHLDRVSMQRAMCCVDCMEKQIDHIMNYCSMLPKIDVQINTSSLILMPCWLVSKLFRKWLKKVKILYLFRLFGTFFSSSTKIVQYFCLYLKTFRESRLSWYNISPPLSNLSIFSFIWLLHPPSKSTFMCSMPIYCQSIIAWVTSVVLTSSLRLPRFMWFQGTIEVYYIILYFI